MLSYSYLGSCRYEHVFKNAYPGRLHSVREINYFLDNLENLKYYLNYNSFSNPILKTFTNMTFGNVFNSYLKNKTFLFSNNLQNFLKSKFLFVEISSLSYATTNCGIIANSSFLKTNAKETTNDYNFNEVFNNKLFVFKKDDFNSVQKEIIKMLEKIKLRTQIQKIFLIPHVNLLSKKTKKKIDNRQEINSIIDKLTKNFNIFEKVNIWDFLQTRNFYQEDILNDNYLNFNKLGNKLIYDYFHSNFKETKDNKNYFILNNPSENIKSKVMKFYKLSDLSTLE